AMLRASNKTVMKGSARLASNDGNRLTRKWPTKIPGQTRYRKASIPASARPAGGQMALGVTRRNCEYQGKPAQSVVEGGHRNVFDKQHSRGRRSISPRTHTLVLSGS